MNIATIPTQELLTDLLDSLTDIKVCQLALTHGIETYSGGSITERMHKNEYFVEVITAELERRGVATTQHAGQTGDW
jgi:hypothetical protein